MPDLTYHALSESDLPLLTAMASDWGTVRQLGSWPWPPDPEFTAFRSRPYEGDGFVWVIELDGVSIGTVAVTGEEVGYCLRKDHWGRGIMSQAACEALEQAFGVLGRDKLHAGVWSDNTASLRVLTKLGFRHESTETVHAKARNVPLLSHIFALTRADWQRLSNRARSAIASV